MWKEMNILKWQMNDIIPGSKEIYSCKNNLCHSFIQTLKVDTLQQNKLQYTFQHNTGTTLYSTSYAELEATPYFSTFNMFWACGWFRQYISERDTVFLLPCISTTCRLYLNSTAVLSISEKILVFHGGSLLMLILLLGLCMLWMWAVLLIPQQWQWRGERLIKRPFQGHAMHGKLSAPWPWKKPFDKVFPICCHCWCEGSGIPPWVCWTKTSIYMNTPTLLTLTLKVEAATLSTSTQCKVPRAELTSIERFSAERGGSSSGQNLVLQHFISRMEQDSLTSFPLTLWCLKKCKILYNMCTMTFSFFTRGRQMARLSNDQTTGAS